MLDVLSRNEVIFTAKNSLDVLSLRREQVWTILVLDNRIYGMRCLFVAVGLNAQYSAASLG